MHKLPSIFLFDMDGTLYLGDRLIDGSVEFVTKLRQREITTVFLSNNSSKNRYEYVEKLKKFNIPADLDDIFTSLSATILYLQEQNIKRLYVLGTPSMEDELKENGFILTNDKPEVVLLGFDKTLNYEKINNAYRHLVKGVRYISTHPDILCPTETGFIPDVGAFMSMFEKATGRMPEVIGKPNTAMVETVLKKYGKTTADCAMVGDRLYTDMRMAIDSKVLSVLVLSGEADMKAYEEWGDKVDIIVDSVKDLIKYWSL